MNRRVKYYPAIIIALITLAVYLPALRNDFVIWDDDGFILNNYHIRSLNWAFFKWAFTDTSLDFWRPVTWIADAVDYAVWGLNPVGYHLTNILLHAADTFFAVILAAGLLEFCGPVPVRSATPHASQAAARDPRFAMFAAAITGILFGLHPVHVESAVWVTGRTDLLCAFFFLPAVSAYIKFASGRADLSVDRLRLNRSYLFSLACFIFAAAGKPSAVVLPAVLLLLDWYPLRRVRSLKSFWQALIEKLPFLAVSLAVSAVVFFGERAQGRMSPAEEVSFAVRTFAALKAVVMYPAQIVAPVNLLPYHPYPSNITLLSAEFLGYLVIVAGITTACILLLKKHKILAAVWAYFLITLLPVIGLIKVRETFMADRYMYLPSLGLFLVIGVGAAWAWDRAGFLKQRNTTAKYITAVAACLLCFGLSYPTLKQISVWKNTITLWSYVIGNEPRRIPLAYLNRGMGFRQAGLPERALEDLTRAIAIDSSQAYAHMAYTDRGIIYKETGRPDLAIEDYTRAVSINPGYADAYANRGIAFNATGRFDRAIADFDRAISLDPGQYQSYIGRGTAYKETGRQGKAIEDYTAAISLNAGNADAYIYRGIAYKETGQFPRALEDYGTAIRLNPASVEAYNNRGVAHKHMGQLDMAVADYDRALALNPSFAPAYMNRGAVLAATGRVGDAARDYQKACDLGTEAGCDALSVYGKRRSE